MTTRLDRTFTVREIQLRIIDWEGNHLHIVTKGDQMAQVLNTITTEAIKGGVSPFHTSRQRTLFGSDDSTEFHEDPEWLKNDVSHDIHDSHDSAGKTEEPGSPSSARTSSSAKRNTTPFRSKEKLQTSVTHSRLDPPKTSGRSRAISRNSAQNRAQSMTDQASATSSRAKAGGSTDSSDNSTSTSPSKTSRSRTSPGRSSKSRPASS